MKRALMVLCAAAVAAFVAGCDGDGGGSDFDIAEGGLAGKIDGKDWKYKSAFTNGFLSDEKDFFTRVDEEEAESCNDVVDSERTVLLNVPTKTGEYELGFDQSVTMAVGSDNKVATTGVIVVESVTEEAVEVGVYAIFNDDPNFEISGHFKATICADDTQ